ncbi:MAG: tetratricopeptide repeat protein [bacterium]
MTKLQRVLGTSILSLLLVIVGLFVVCSGRVQDVAFEDEFVEDEYATDSENTDSSSSTADDLLGRLELLEEGSGESSGFDSTMAALDGMGEGNDQVGEAESFLTAETFNNLQGEVNELSSISSSKTRMIDSLRAELDIVNSQKSAIGSTASTRSGGKIRSEADVYNTEYGMAYQDALDDFYVRNYDRAIRKFRELLARDDRSPLADNCQYWIGEAFYAMGNYYQAIAEFQKVLPLENSNKSNDAQLMIGISLIKAGEPEVARTELNTVINFAGNSASAQKAMRYLKILNNA